MNLHMCAKFVPDRTTGGDVYTPGRIHTHTHTYMCIIFKASDCSRSLSLLIMLNLYSVNCHQIYYYHELFVQSFKFIRLFSMTRGQAGLRHGRFWLGLEIHQLRPWEMKMTKLTSVARLLSQCSQLLFSYVSTLWKGIIHRHANSWPCSLVATSSLVAT